MTTKNISTTDIVLAATLRCLDYRLLSIEREGTKGLFIFRDVDEEDLLEYDLQQCLIEPQSFNAALRQLATAAKRLS
jgi:hypothetical protein